MAPKVKRSLRAKRLEGLAPWHAHRATARPRWLQLARPRRPAGPERRPRSGTAAASRAQQEARPRSREPLLGPAGSRSARCFGHATGDGERPGSRRARARDHAPAANGHASDAICPAVRDMDARDRHLSPKTKRGPGGLARSLTATRLLRLRRLGAGAGGRRSRGRGAGVACAGAVSGPRCSLNSTRRFFARAAFSFAPLRPVGSSTGCSSP